MNWLPLSAGSTGSCAASRLRYWFRCWSWVRLWGGGVLRSTQNQNQNLLSASSTEALGPALGKVTLGLLQTLAGRFSLLCHLTGQHASSLSANVRRSRSVRSLLVLEHTGLFLDSYHQ